MHLPSRVEDIHTGQLPTFKLSRIAELNENERCVKCRNAIKKLLDKQTQLALAGALPEEEAVEKPKKPASG